jgi:hypothetical protein
MDRECELLDQFRKYESELKACIHGKDWSGLESVIEVLTAMAESLAEIEGVRHEQFDILRRESRESPEATFYQVIVHLPVADRERLAALYRKMKITVLNIQTITWCINEHVQAINDALQQVLDELFPHRKGLMYSKEGTRAESGTNPLLINRSL